MSQAIANSSLAVKLASFFVAICPIYTAKLHGLEAKNTGFVEK